MQHPKVAGIACATCKAFMFDAEWNLQKHRITGAPVPRTPGLPTPCGSCPRESPEREVLTTLTEKNARAYHFWQEVRAAGGYLQAWSALSGRLPDKTTLAILATVDEVMRQHELTLQIEAMSLGAVSAATRKA